MQMSKFSLYSEDRQRSGLDAISDIYSILRDEAARTNKMDVSYAHALNWISRKVSDNLDWGLILLIYVCIQLCAFTKPKWRSKQLQGNSTHTHTQKKATWNIFISWN